MTVLRPGEIQLRGVSRNFKIVHERNATLKEALLRRKRTSSATVLWALRDVDLDITPGESVGIIGQNGAGKSTLLKLVARILPPQSGTVEVGGAVASMLELGAGFHPDFTGRENVYMNGSIYGLSEREITKRLPTIVAFSELSEFIDMPVKTYSSGMQMRLAFAVASHVNPDVLLLDEVLAVGDESFQQKCFGRIFDFKRRGGTIVFVSHDPGAIERICGRAIFLLDGRIVADGAPAEVLSTYHRFLADEWSPAGRKSTADETRVSLRPSSHSDANTASEDQMSGSQSPEEDGADPDELDSPREWGTRRVTVTGFRLIGTEGVTDRLLSGDPLRIEIDLLAHEPTPRPNIGIMIHFVDGPVCYGTNTRLDDLPIEVMAGIARVVFTVPAIHLHTGRFSVTFAVTSQDEDVIYHWLERAKEFTVFQRSTGIGPVDLSGKWSIVSLGDGLSDGGGGDPDYPT